MPRLTSLTTLLFALVGVFSLSDSALAVKGCPPGTRVCSVDPKDMVSTCCKPGELCVAGSCEIPAKTGFILPRYVIVAILYPAPGNAGQIIYGQGSTFGSTYEVTDSLKNSGGWTLGGGVSYKSDVVSVGLDGAGSDSFTSQSDTSTGFKIDKSLAYTLTLKSGSDDIDPWQDMLILWVDPQIDLSQQGTALGGDLEPTSSAGVRNPMVLVAALARQLRDRTFSPSQAKLLANLKDDDYQQILNQIPNLKGDSLAKHSDRYELQRTTLPVAGPATAGDPALLSSLALSSTNTRTWKTEGTVSQVTGNANGISIMNISFKKMNEVTYSHRTTDTAASAFINNISGAVGSTTVGYNKTFLVYLDKVFGTFAFEEATDAQGNGLRKKSAAGVKKGDPRLSVGCEKPYVLQGKRCRLPK